MDAQTNLSTRDAITRLLFIADEPEPVDLTVVLGSKWKTTMDPAIGLYRQRWTPKILVTGHGPLPEQHKECELFCQYALDQGVREEDLLREEEATNTLENFVLSREVVEREIGFGNIQKVAIVCKAFHSRRALMTAREHWPQGIRYLMLPSSDEHEIRPEGWWEDDISRSRVLAEVRRIGEYAERGHLSIE